MLFRLRLCCIVRVDHPEIQGRLSLAQYLKYPHIILGAVPNPVSTIETAVDKQLRNRRLTRKIGARVSDLLLSLAIVAETDFIAIVSERLAGPFVRPFGLQILEPPLPLDDASILMIWHERTHHDSRHRMLRRIIRSLAKQS
jgi:DNA-binding transcriptional LysR family regulator